jgi:hypothetical protein
MACGEAYLKKYAVTPNGKTIDDPYSPPASFRDYERWRGVASRMWELMHFNFVVLGEEEDRRVKAGDLAWESSKWNELVGEAGSPDGSLYKRLQAFHGAVWQSFDDWPEITWANDIDELRALIRDIACTWEKVDKALATYDPKKVPDQPTADEPKAGKFGGGSKLDVGEWINNVVAIGIFAAIAYGAYKLVSMDSKSDEGGE